MEGGGGWEGEAKEKEPGAPSGEARVRFRAMGELRGDAEVGGGAQAAWGWLRSRGMEFGLGSVGAWAKPCERILMVETCCDVTPLMLAPTASVCRRPLPPPSPRLSVVPIGHAASRGQKDSTLATVVRWTGSPEWRALAHILNGIEGEPEALLGRDRPDDPVVGLLF